MPDQPVIVAVAAVVGALATGATARSRPLLALGLLFLMASFSRATLETPLGTMRLEMPAIAALGLALLGAGRVRMLTSLPRTTLAIAVGFALFLSTLAMSSAFLAPGTAQSLRMVAWFAISMSGGIVAFILAEPQPTDAMRPLAFAGAVSGAVGFGAAALFLVAGPGFHPGVQEFDAILPRVYALGWEANLYASFLAMTVFFAFDDARRHPGRISVTLLAIILIGLPLGVTRGAYAGLAAGAIAYAAVLVSVEPRARLLRRTGPLVRTGVLALAMLGVGIVASRLLLPNADVRAAGLFPFGAPTQTGAASASPAQTGAPSASPAQTGAPSASPAETGAHSPVPGMTPAPTADPGQTAVPSPGATQASSPTPTLAPYPDTLAFRLERVPIALEDLGDSPLIGLGAESFGQRHPDRHAGSGQDHIAILAVVVPYEAGILGAAALALGFAVLLLALWRSARRASRQGDLDAAGAAAAFVGALVTILVAYQLNNALQFAVNWIVIGAAVALTTKAGSGRDSSAISSVRPEPEAQAAETGHHIRG